MLFPIVEPAEWANKYNLGLQKSVCLKCKNGILLNVPIATKKYRGFRTPEHGCPPEYHQYLLAPVDAEEELNLRMPTTTN